MDESVRILRRHGLVLLGIALLVDLPVSLAIYAGEAVYLPSRLNELLGQGPLDPLSNALWFEEPGRIAFTLLIVLFSLPLIDSLGAAALSWAAAQARFGQRPTVQAAYRAVARRWLPLWGVKGVLWLAVLVALVLTIIPLVGWLIAPGLVLFLRLLVWPLTAPVTVLEEGGLWYSLRRTWDLARRRFWWLLGLVGLTGTFTFCLFTVTQILTLWSIVLVLGGVFQIDLANPDFWQWNLAINSILDLVFSVLGFVVTQTCLTLTYLDLRVRQEGLDLALAADGEVISAVQHIALAPRAELQPVWQRHLALQFALVTLLIIALVVAITILIVAPFWLLSLIE